MEQKNRSHEDLSMMMFHETNISKYFWVEVVSISCKVMNHFLIIPILNQTHMSYTKEVSLILLTSMCSYANVLFSITRMVILESFTLNLMKVDFKCILLIIKLLEFSINNSLLVKKYSCACYPAREGARKGLNWCYYIWILLFIHEKWKLRCHISC